MQSVGLSFLVHVGFRNLSKDPSPGIPLLTSSSGLSGIILININIDFPYSYTNYCYIPIWSPMEVPGPIFRLCDHWTNSFTAFTWISRAVWRTWPWQTLNDMFHGNKKITFTKTLNRKTLKNRTGQIIVYLWIFLWKFRLICQEDERNLSDCSILFFFTDVDHQQYKSWQYDEKPQSWVLSIERMGSPHLVSPPMGRMEFQMDKILITWWCWWRRWW